MSKQEIINLGSEASFKELPARIVLGDRSYFLVRNQKGYQLLSTVCPHQGGEVVDAGTHFECPYHRWRFDHESGKCINTLNESLSSIAVNVRDGHLFAEVPVSQTHLAPTTKEFKQRENLTIQLHAHACLEIKYQGFSLLTDPWLVGPAFLGAWMHYPATIVDVTTLKPDAIWISHEHSDHFHEPTVVNFDRSTPIYVPDFPNRRLIERLTALGFTNIHCMSFGETYEVAEGIKLTCFEPESLWNDSMVLMEFGDFRILNVNDAGLNQRIASRVGPVDVVASSFSPGASGYPLTWTHLSEDEKVNIMQRSRQGTLQMLKEAMSLYKAKYLLPFASHFTLWHPAHRDYLRLMQKNTVNDVVKAFADREEQVVNILPGETWDVSTGKVTCLWRNRERLYDRDQILRYVERRFKNDSFKQYHPVATNRLTRDDVERYFLRLNETSEISYCENLTVRLKVIGEVFETSEVDLSFEIRDGHLSILREAPEAPDLSIEIPSNILSHIVAENISWDEAHIGYWCKFARPSDVYHAGFWRLLQAPYFNRPAGLSAQSSEPVLANTVIADLIESHGERAERILRRYGMYCTGCQHSTFDTIALGAKHHGIEERQVNRLIKELNKAFHLAG